MLVCRAARATDDGLQREEDIMDPIAIVLGLVIGIPASLLAYWYTKRNQKLGLGGGDSGDYTSGGHHGGGDSGGDGGGDA